METQTFTFASSPFVPVAIGFFGLGTGYFIWGGQALFLQQQPRRITSQVFRGIRIAAWKPCRLFDNDIFRVRDNPSLGSTRQCESAEKEGADCPGGDKLNS